MKWHWTAAEDDQIVELSKAGVPVDEIARRLKRTYQAVCARRTAMRKAGRLGPRTRGKQP